MWGGLHGNPEMVPGLGFSPEKATDPAVATRIAYGSRSDQRCRVWWSDAYSRMPLQLGAPGFEESQTRECARGLSRYSGTVEVLSSSWTPSLLGRVVVRLRKRRQWDSDS
ncbi:hypothetical protein Taro_040340 [Colocasia esculenta]|uniref:Uncharacterized protein n=1 Tax=Colocasia esculenta TaxID=4460 RepID=A0A843WBM3_COLES|nr:hypothetical protein [Colocasia esculenta]